MGTFSYLEENDSAFAYYLVYDKSRYDHKEYRAKCKAKMELAPVNVVVRVLYEEPCYVEKIFVLDFFVGEKLLFCYSGTSFSLN